MEVQVVTVEKVEVEKIVEVKVYDNGLSKDSMIGIIVGSTIFGLVMLACLCCCLTSTGWSYSYFKRTEEAPVVAKTNSNVIMPENN